MVLAMALASSCLAKLHGEVTDAAGGGWAVTAAQVACR
jgi:hypothetical protein